MIKLDVLATQQAYSFLIFVINGIGIGILFDIFRVLRRSFHTLDMITYIEDILFWILAGCLTLFTIFTFNNGEIRLYIFLGILLGVVIYLLTISKYFIKLNTFLITILKKWITGLIHIICYPFILIIKGLRKLLLKPISFITINLKKILRKMTKPSKKQSKKFIFFEKKQKKTCTKEGF